MFSWGASFFFSGAVLLLAIGLTVLTDESFETPTEFENSHTYRDC